jgi:heat shock protein HtpX
MEPDRRLRLALALTVALSVVGYLAVPAALVGTVAVAYALGGVVNAAGVAGVLAVGTWIAVRSSASVDDLLDVLEARPVDPATRPRLYGAVTRVAAQFDTPVPAVRVAPTDDPNALSVRLGTGLGDGTETRARAGAVVVTEGLLETLPEEELEAVLAHEVAHLANRDATALSWAKRPADYLRTLARFGLGVGLIVAATGGLVLASSAGAVPAVVGVAYLWLVAVPAALGLLLWPVVRGGRWVVGTLARTREFAADAAAARATDPAALAGALRRLDADLQSRDASDLRAVALTEFYLLPIGDDEYHPSTVERVRRLERLSATDG